MRISRFASRIGFSATAEIDERVRQLRREGREVFDFGVGQPDHPTPAGIAEAGIAAIRRGETKYTSPMGTSDLRGAIAEKLARENRLTYSPEDEILVSSGAKSALHCLLAAILNPGEEVILPTPTWVSYPEMIRLLGGEPKFVPTDLEARFRLRADALRDAIGPRVVGLVLNSPCNPTGAVYAAEELRDLVVVIREAGLWVITDEIYEKIVFDTHEHVSLAAVDQDLRRSVAVVSGVSKSYAMTGWRIGYAAGPADWIGLAVSIQSHQTGNACSISQAAARCALASCGEEIERMRVSFQRRRDLLVELLTGTPGLELLQPEGTFYLFPRVTAFLGPRGSGRTLEADTDLASWLLEETGVATVPGTAFAAPGHIRLSFATGKEVLSEGATRLREALVRLGPARPLENRGP